MNDRQIRTFICVADLGSFSAAGRKLFISPQAVLQQIDLLENEVGVALLNRTNRGVTLTKAGRLFYDGAQDLLRHVENLLYTVREDGLERKALRIGIFDDSAMMSIVCESFSQKYPTIIQEYMLVRSEEWMDHLSSVRNGRLDVFEHVYLPNEALEGLVFTPLTRCGCCCVMSPNNPVATKQELTIRDLSGLKIGVHDASCVPGLKETLNHEAIGSLLFDGNLGPISAFDLCSTGGVFIVPTLFRDQFRPLKTIPLASPLTWTFGVISRADNNPTVALFIENAKREFINREI